MVYLPSLIIICCNNHEATTSRRAFYVLVRSIGIYSTHPGNSSSIKTSIPKFVNKNISTCFKRLCYPICDGFVVCNHPLLHMKQFHKTEIFSDSQDHNSRPLRILSIVDWERALTLTFFGLRRAHLLHFTIVQCTALQLLYNEHLYDTLHFFCLKQYKEGLENFCPS